MIYLTNVYFDNFKKNERKVESTSKIGNKKHLIKDNKYKSFTQNNLNFQDILDVEIENIEENQGKLKI